MQKNNKGFTLIELVVVMAIIAVLAALMVSAIVAARKQATSTQRTGNLKTIEVGLESRAAKCNGQYLAAVTSGVPAVCNTAVAITNTYDLAGSLVIGGFLTTNPIVSTTDATSNYPIVSISATNNTYNITATNGGDIVYTAQR